MKHICLKTSWKRTEEVERTVTHSSNRPTGGGGAYRILRGKITRLFILSSWLADQDFVREIRAVIGQSLWQNNNLEPQHLLISICSLDISQQFFIPIIFDVKTNMMQIKYYWKCLVFFTIGGSQYLNIICIKIYMMTHAVIWDSRSVYLRIHIHNI